MDESPGIYLSPFVGSKNIFSKHPASELAI